MSGTSKVLHPGALGVGSLGRLERKNARRVGTRYHGTMGNLDFFGDLDYNVVPHQWCERWFITPEKP